MDNELTITRGDNEGLLVTVTISEVAFNLTGYTVRFSAKKSLSDQDDLAIISKEGTLLNPSGGTAIIPLEPLDTTVPAGIYFYDVQITSNDYNYTIINSTITVVSDVTKNY